MSFVSVINVAKARQPVREKAQKVAHSFGFAFIFRNPQDSTNIMRDTCA